MFCNNYNYNYCTTPTAGAINNIQNSARVVVFFFVNKNAIKQNSITKDDFNTNH